MTFCSHNSYFDEPSSLVGWSLFHFLVFLASNCPVLCSPFVALEKVGLAVVAAVFGCYGPRQGILERGSFGMWTIDATVLDHNVGLLELELRRVKMMQPSCCAEGLRGVEQCCASRPEQG